MKHDVPGICDRCGGRYLLKELKQLVVLRKTNLLVCSDCWEESHPQLDTRRVKTNDKQSVKNSRSDAAELAASRGLYSWDPVGHESTNVLSLSLGTVRVTIT